MEDPDLEECEHGNMCVHIVLKME
ncbi:hypothetical protein CCACVL1_07320 [Corchorus capsularis]|uniref:Uncharacterized protein n=1 Tax=Corchorus capsularis TaxID=210143 RepID=A0A1R3J770_COCAP|nr:hypothetical protein CCACVL1_07320 [Corchorus capsularis]